MIDLFKDYQGYEVKYKGKGGVHVVGGNRRGLTTLLGENPQYTLLVRRDESEETIGLRIDELEEREEENDGKKFLRFLRFLFSIERKETKRWLEYLPKEEQNKGLTKREGRIYIGV